MSITPAILMIIPTIICSGHSRIRRFNSPLGLLVQKAFHRIIGRASEQSDQRKLLLGLLPFLSRLTTLKVIMPKPRADSITGHPLGSTSWNRHWVWWPRRQSAGLKEQSQQPLNPNGAETHRKRKSSPWNARFFFSLAP